LVITLPPDKVDPTGVPSRSLILTARRGGAARFANLRRRSGYAIALWASPVRVYAIRLDALTNGPLFPDLPDKPSIAVLPFDNMSADEGQDYLADGIVEAITATLSRVRSFFVIRAHFRLHVGSMCAKWVANWEWLIYSKAVCKRWATACAFSFS
jgi:hypothetical protein